MFKESLFKHFVSFSLPRRIHVGDGYLLNEHNEITTQCDVILYDGINSTLMYNDKENKFFPHEIVFAIGEIKSVLSMEKLCNALVKLAKQKMIRNHFNGGVTIDGISSKDHNPQNPYHNMFSFLLCNEIKNFDKNKLLLEMNKIYDEEGIELIYRHNVIVSLKDGVITYKANKDIESISDKKIPIGTFCPFPHYNGSQLDQGVFTGNKTDVIKQFIIHQNNFLANCTLWYPEPNNYII